MSLTDALRSIEPGPQARNQSPLVTLLDEVYENDRDGYTALIEKLDDPLIRWQELKRVLDEHFGPRNVGETSIRRWRNGQLHKGNHPRPRGES